MRWICSVRRIKRPRSLPASSSVHDTSPQQIEHPKASYDPDRHVPGISRLPARMSGVASNPDMDLGNQTSRVNQRSEAHGPARNLEPKRREKPGGSSLARLVALSLSSHDAGCRDQKVRPVLHGLEVPRPVPGLFTMIAVTVTKGNRSGHRKSYVKSFNTPSDRMAVSTPCSRSPASALNGGMPHLATRPCGPPFTSNRRPPHSST